MCKSSLKYCYYEFAQEECDKTSLCDCYENAEKIRKIEIMIERCEGVIELIEKAPLKLNRNKARIYLEICLEYCKEELILAQKEGKELPQ